jgi:hypothetical protein
MLSPLPRRSDWAYCVTQFALPYQPSPIWQSGRPAHCPFRGLLGVHSRYGLHTRAVTVYRDSLSEGFSHFVTSMTAPVASGWSGRRVGFTPTGKRRLFTAHAISGLWRGKRRRSLRRCLDHCRRRHAHPLSRALGPDRKWPSQHRLLRSF